MVGVTVYCAHDGVLLECVMCDGVDNQSILPLVLTRTHDCFLAAPVRIEGGSQS